MSYQVVVSERMERAAYRRLCDLVGEAAVRRRGARTVVSVPDRSALVTTLSEMNDLCIEIDEVRRVP